MRLTAELVQLAPQRLNPLGDREILLRAFKIPAIENTGTLRDAFDYVDLSDNEIKRLGNFTRSVRLKVLLLNNNNISRIDATLGSQLLNLDTLVLTGNKIDRLGEVDALARCPKLQSLSLLDNPICRSPHYRPYVIAKGPPSLKLLDFRKIKRVERVEARKLFPLDGPPTVDINKPAPPPPPRAPNGGQGNALSSLTDQQKMQIRAAVEAAQTPEEVDRLERQLRAGVIPTLQPRPPSIPPPPSALPRVPPPPPPTPSDSPNHDNSAQSPPKPPLNGSSQDVPVPPSSLKTYSQPHPPPDPAATYNDPTEDRDVTMVPANSKSDHREKETEVNVDLAPAQPSPSFAFQATDVPSLQQDAPLAQEHADGQTTEMATEMQVEDSLQPQDSHRQSTEPQPEEHADVQTTEMATEMQVEDSLQPRDSHRQSTEPQPAEHAPVDVNMDVGDDGSDKREKEVASAEASSAAHQNVASSINEQPDVPPVKAIEPTQPSTSHKESSDVGTKARSLSRADLDKMTVAQLKTELHARSLPTSGLKAVLKKRLSDAL